MAVILEYIEEEEMGKSLAQELSTSKISPKDYESICRHIVLGMKAIREAGASVKEVALDKVYIKNGYCKIVDCPLFLSEKNEKVIEAEAEKKGVEVDDVLAFGIFFLHLILRDSFDPIVENLLKQPGCQSLYPGDAQMTKYATELP
jgi:hypothetical protein